MANDELAVVLEAMQDLHANVRQMHAESISRIWGFTPETVPVYSVGIFHEMVSAAVEVTVAVVINSMVAYSATTD